jgi:hypothetical protein
MSWSFNAPKLADKAAARAEVERQAEVANGHFPDAAKQVVLAAIDALPDCEDSTISVRSFGHFQTGEYRGTSNYLIEVSNSFAEKPNG